MRQITETVVGAFLRGEACKLKNTRTDGTSLWLFDNMIASYTREYGMQITTAGWNTQTTRERLNGITGVHVTTRRGKLYLNGNEWSGDWTFISWFGGGGRERVEPEAEVEVEYDLTSEWNDKGFIMPVYSVFHTNNESDVQGVVETLNGRDIPSRIIETDTAGVYRPNYFVVVQPENFNLSLNLLSI